MSDDKHIDLELSNLITSNNTEYCDPKDITIVTGIFDLSIRDKNRRYSTNERLTWGNKLMSLPHKMVIYGDPELMIDIFKLRVKLGFEDITYIYTISLENSPYYKYWKSVNHLYNINGLPKYHSISNESPYYIIASWTHIWMLGQISKLNPLDSKYILGLNFNIAQSYNNKDNLFKLHISKVLDIMPVNLIKCMLFNHDNKIWSENSSTINDYYSTRRWNISSGLIGANLTNMFWLSQQIELEIYKCMQGKYPGMDELMLNLVYINNRSKFSVYYGDTSDILFNSIGSGGGLKHIKEIAVYCRTHNMWTQLIEVCQYVLLGIINIQCDVGPIELIAWLDELYIAYFYIQSKDTAIIVGKIMEKLINENKDKIINIAHLRSNLKCIGITI